MQTEDRTSELVELGSVTADTQGQGGVILEGFTLIPKAGISAD
jgi:hypothetical protein